MKPKWVLTGNQFKSTAKYVVQGFRLGHSTHFGWFIIGTTWFQLVNSNAKPYAPQTK